MDMIGRVARGLFQKFRIEYDVAPDVTWDEHDVHTHHHEAYLSAAKVAIEAMQSGECICVKCGVRHGIVAPLDGGVPF